ncbi:MAG: hypothetical protein QNJ70_26080 [Xenococcaceae cyanobacterium MO_207.B15]|nr:hypothetical protein [Xenococcaceae cyanobacterium MO_207.B15]
MHSRTHSPTGKSNIPINTTLVAKQQKTQPVNSPKSELSDPKFNFHLSNIPISSPNRPLQPPPRINPKLSNKKFLNQEERETEQKNPKTALQTFAPSTPVQPQEEDEPEKQLQKQQLREKSNFQQQPLDLPGKLQPQSGSSIHLNKMLISVPRRSLKTPFVEPKLKVRIPSPKRLQQQAIEKREEPPAEEISNKAAIASSSTSPNAVDGDNPRETSNFAVQARAKLVGERNKNRRSLQKSVLKVSPLQPKIANRNSTKIVLTKPVASPQKSSAKNQEKSQQKSAKLKTPKEQNQAQSPATPAGKKESAPKASKTPSAKTQGKKSGTGKKALEGKGKEKPVSVGAKGTAVKPPDTGKKDASGAKAPTSPEADPAFQVVVGKAKKVAQQEKQHEPAKTKANQAQAAAVAPPSEVESKGQANQMGEMEQAETPGFDKAAFKAKLMERIAEMAPKNLEEADDFKNNNKLESVKGELSGKVKEEQEGSQKPLEDKSKEAPDTSGIEPKAVTPLPPTQPGAAPSSVGAEGAVPKSKGKGEVEAPLQENSKQLDQQMAEADVTEEQLAKSNEPQFKAAITAKKEAQTDSQQAPQAYRQSEEAELSQAQAEAVTTSEEKLQGMHGDRAKLLTQVVGKQTEGKGKDEQSRAKVAGDIQQIYSETKTKVESILSGLDTKVETAFDTGAAKAKQLFEDYVDVRMSAYKAKRYSGVIGAGRWLKDKLLGMPSEVNKFYQEGKKLYLNKMDRVIDQVVNIVGDGLSQAKNEVANGRKRVQNYVNQLPANLKSIGQEAASDIQSEFDSLEESVDAKQDELIDKLAQKYQENVQALDARIEEMKAANQGLVDKAANFIKGVIETIKKLKEMLTKVLAKVAEVVGKIIKDPIGFLGNLVKGLKQGFDNFAGNIGKHLQAGLIGWLTGAMGGVGIQIPDDIFSLKGIFNLVMQILGLTWDYIRKKAVKLFGAPVVAAMEKGSEVFQALMQGPDALWEYVKEQFGDLKETVIEAIKEMVITQVITAGIKWILGLLNPVGAFIKAAMAIYEIIMFFVNNAARIIDLINAIVDAVGAIARGAIGAAAKLVENALAKAIPIVIGFLASLLGISGLAKKVQAIVKKVRKRIDKAIDKMLMKAKKAIKKLFKGKKGKAGKGKKEKEGKFTKQDRTAGLAAFAKEEKPFIKNGGINQKDAQKVANIVKNKHPVFKSISVIDGKDSWDYQYIFRTQVKDTTQTPKAENASDPEQILQDIKAIINPYLKPIDSKKSIPGTKAKANKSQREKIQPLGSEFGCFTCPSRPEGQPTQVWIADHMPPTELINAGLAKGPQSLYPQSRENANRQGQVVGEILKHHAAGNQEKVQELLQHPLVNPGSGPSISATGPEASDSERKKIQELGAEHGGHHGAKATGVKYIADHNPPRSIIKIIDSVNEEFNAQISYEIRLVPQCQKCSDEQSTRADVNKLNELIKQLRTLKKGASGR